MTEPRRSTRVRRHVETIYEQQARESLGSNTSSARKRSRSKEPKKDDREDDEIEKEEEEKSVMATEISDEDSDDDDVQSKEVEEDFFPIRKRKSPRKSPVPKVKASSTVNRPAVSRTKGTASTNPSVLRGIVQKFKAANETPENSLALALLTSNQSGPATRTKKPMIKRDKLQSTSTSNLQKIAQSVIAIHNQESPNKAHILLCNLIFRSVGGSFDHLLNDQDFDLEEMAEEDWNEPLERFIRDMEEAPVTLLELGKPSSNAIAQYRTIFEDFFYQLGKMAISEGSMSRRKQSGSSKQGDNSESDSDEESNAFENNNATFQIQVARDIVSRLVEMFAFSVPNIRAAVCIAVYRMGAALLEKTVELLAQLQTAERQNKVAKRSRSSRKSEALETQIASWKRMLAEIEAIVQETIMGIFIKRYRDSNAYVRAEALRAIAGLALIRPDRFLNSMYLKYIGWMLSDKDATVREAALLGLLEPFRQAEKRKKQAELGMPIDLSGMDSVINKFLSRLADCSLDVDPNVQEVAMELLLALVRENYFDNVDNDSIWEQINLRAISPNATPRVRRDALYFVMEQLSSFDAGPAKTESAMVDQINQLVDWIAHCLSDGDIHIDEIRYELADLVVASLRSMQEHKHLVSNWAAMLRALKGDDSKPSGRSVNMNKSEQRLDIVKQRVLLQMLVTTAKQEIGYTEEFASKVADPGWLKVRNENDKETQMQPAKKQKVSPSAHEALTLDILRALPDLLTSFKSETSVLQILTTLPQYILPNVLSLTSRRKDYQDLISNLSSIFLESTDPVTLKNCITALTFLAKGEHTRSDEALVCLKEAAVNIRSRVMLLLREKSEVTGCDDQDSNASDLDRERSICLCLRRLVVLAKRWDLSILLSSSTGGTVDDEELAVLFNSIAHFMLKELQIRRCLEYDDAEDEVAFEIPKIWNQSDESIHVIVAESLSEGFDLLMCIAMWRMKKEVDHIDSGKVHTDEEIREHILILMRDGLMRLIFQCFEHHILPDSDLIKVVSKNQLDFSIAVQYHAVRTSGDLRVLFPRDWSKSTSPLLAACALTDDSVMLGASVRFIRFLYDDVQSDDKFTNIEQRDRKLLLPSARGLASNWKTGNRKSASSILQRLHGDGKYARELSLAFTRILKRIDPTRLLEAHMATLSQSFETWLGSYPEELGDRPTDQEMAQFEAEMKSHYENFESIAQHAGRLAASIGIGKSRDQRLANALKGFILEGIRISFSRKNIQNPDGEMLPLGSRLLFLRVVSKYLTVSNVRRDKEFRAFLAKFFNEKETELREHPDYDDIYEDEIKVMQEFRSLSDIGDFVASRGTTDASTVETSRGIRTIQSNTSRQSIGASTMLSSQSSQVSAKSKDGLSLERIQEEDEGRENIDVQSSLGSKTSPQSNLASLSHTPGAKSVETLFQSEMSNSCSESMKSY